MSLALQTMLNAHGLKVTHARLALLEVLKSSRQPLDVEYIAKYFSQKHIRADEATLYRTLTIFFDKGIIRQVELHEGKRRYELSSLPHHHHIVCDECGAIEDVTIENEGLLINKATKKSAFLIKRHSLEFFGLCTQCQC